MNWSRRRIGLRVQAPEPKSGWRRRYAYLTQIHEDNVMNRLKATELGEAFGHLASGEGAQSNRCATR